MYYFFDDMTNIKNLDPNKMKVDEKSYKNVLIYCVKYVTVKSLQINSVHPLYLIIEYINGYIEENMGNIELPPNASSSS